MDGCDCATAIATLVCWLELTADPCDIGARQDKIAELPDSSELVI